MTFGFVSAEFNIMRPLGGQARHRRSELKRRVSLYGASRRRATRARPSGHLPSLGASEPQGSERLTASWRSHGHPLPGQDRTPDSPSFPFPGFCGFLGAAFQRENSGTPVILSGCSGHPNRHLREEGRVGCEQAAGGGVGRQGRWEPPAPRLMPAPCAEGVF